MSEWQPIETAPKDGTFIITVVEGYVPAITKWVEVEGVARFSEDPETFMEEGHFREYFFGSDYRPTHWQPLPEPPVAPQRSHFPDITEGQS